MQIRELTIGQTRLIYEKYMCDDFTADEMKPFNVIEKLMEQKVYICCGLYDDENLKAYACLFSKDKNSCILIDYYAVISLNRGQGYGSIFLRLLRKKFYEYKGCIAEVEKVDTAYNEQERKIRERRVNFYLRNGMQKTEISSRLFDSEFQIMYMPINKSRDDVCVYDEIKYIYYRSFPKKIREKYIKLYID
jgi:hypothetical protein